MNRRGFLHFLGLAPVAAPIAVAAAVQASAAPPIVGMKGVGAAQGIAAAAGVLEHSALAQADAEFIASRQFQIEEICRWFAISPADVLDDPRRVTA